MRLTCSLLWLVASATPLAAQWTLQRSGTGSEFRGLHAVDERVVWAAGRGGVVTRTTDGGSTWRADSIPGAAGLFLVAVRALDERRAWALGTAFSGPSAARIYFTEDGGRHWRLQYENTTTGVFFDGMAFWDSRHGIAFGDPIDGTFFVITTDDGGAHWTRIPADRLPRTLTGEAAFAASGTAITVRGSREVWIASGGGARARVFHSRDRGATWAVFDTPLSGGTAKGLFGIAFEKSEYGVAVGGDYQQGDASTENLLLSDDGGRSWRTASSPGLVGVQYGVVHMGGGGFLSAGPGASARSRDRGRTWTRLEGAGFNAVSCAGKLCWAAGTEGRIGRLER
jgi:photosystem II stability/assembly factor-like uncharacterized protein